MLQILQGLHMCCPHYRKTISLTYPLYINACQETDWAQKSDKKN